MCVSLYTNAQNALYVVEASTGIEPVYTDLQSAASWQGESALEENRRPRPQEVAGR